MKTISRIGVIIVALLLVSTSEQPVTFTVGEWEPFTGSSLPGKGIASEIVSAVCSEARIPIQIKFMPWTRAEKLVFEGQAFASFPYAKNEDREAKYNFSDPIFYTTTQFAYYSALRDFSSLRITSWADVKPHKVAYLSGSVFEKAMKDAGITVILVADIENAVRMLQAGRVDLIVDEPAVYLTAIRKLFPNEVDKFKLVDSPLFGPPIPVHLMVSRTYPHAAALLARINAGLAVLKTNGTLAGFAKRYGIRVNP